MTGEERWCALRNPTGTTGVRAIGAMLILAMVLCAGCGDSAPAPGITVTTDTLDGVERVTYSRERASELDWVFDTTAIVGGYQVEDPAYRFGRLAPQWAAASHSGDVYVFDSDGVRVLGYGADGRAIGEWGREGGGPGEIGGRSIGALAVGPGDSLWIADPINQRITVLPMADPAGLPTSISLQATGRVLNVAALTVDRNGAVGQIDAVVFDPQASSLPPQVLVRFNRSETSPALDTLWVAAPRSARLVELGSRASRFSIMDEPLFQPRLYWGRFSDGHIAVQDGPEYEIRILDPAGRTSRLIRRDPPARSTSDEDRQAVIDRTLAPPDGTEDTPEAAAGRRPRAETLTFAERIPRIVGLRIDSSDRMWVGVSEQEPGEVARIDVFDRQGRLLGELRDAPLPDRFLAGGHAILLGRDELDVQQIVVLSLREESPGGDFEAP